MQRCWLYVHWTESLLFFCGCCCCCCYCWRWSFRLMSKTEQCRLWKKISRHTCIYQHRAIGHKFWFELCISICLFLCCQFFFIAVVVYFVPTFISFSIIAKQGRRRRRREENRKQKKKKIQIILSDNWNSLNWCVRVRALFLLLFVLRAFNVTSLVTFCCKLSHYCYCCCW